MTSNRSSAVPTSLSNVLQIAQAILLAVFAVVPAFLVGSMAVGIRAEFELGQAALGFAIAWFFITTSFMTATLGRRADGVASRSSLTIGASLSAIALFSIGASRSYGTLILSLTLGGIANAASQPAVNASLSRRIPAERLGLAFGIKQSAIPAATLLGGLAVPTLGVWVGWRGTFSTAGSLALVGALVVWFTGDVTERPAHRRRLPLRSTQANLDSLLILTFGGLLAAAAATSLGAFMVDAAVESGITESRAGIAAAAASAVGLTSRVLIGWYADRHPLASRYGMITLLVVLGVPGFLMLATGIPVLYLAGATLAYAAGWGWTGLFHYTVVSQNPTMPATSSGVIQTGLSFGAGLGPLVMGSVTQATSYAVGWLTAAGLGIAGAAFFAYGRLHLRRNLSRAVVETVLEPRVLEMLRDHPGRESAALATFGGNTVAIVRLPAGEDWRSRGSTVAGTVAVLGGTGLRFRIGLAHHELEAGRALMLPPHLIWSVANTGSVPACFAVLTPARSEGAS